MLCRVENEWGPVDYDIKAPYKDAATMLDKTYSYRTDVGDQKDLVIYILFNPLYHCRCPLTEISSVASWAFQAAVLMKLAMPE